MIYSIIKVLVVEFFIIAVKLSNSWMESDHKIFILHHVDRCCNYLLSCLISCLGIEWAEDYTPRRIIFQKTVLVSLDATFCELSI